jgi:hypothetical protein
MLRGLASIAAPASLVWAAVLLPVTPGVAQTPEQQQLWDAQRAQSLAAAKARAEQLERERAARKADPMSWVRTLDPLTSGGWEFRTVAEDGSWAAYSTDHQLKRSGKIVTIWLRQEFAEPQHDANGDNYLSTVQKVDYDCGKDRARPVLVMYYADNNIRGSAETEEADPKQAPWNPIVPGTLGEYNFLWACNREHAGGGK